MLGEWEGIYEGTAVGKGCQQGELQFLLAQVLSFFYTTRNYCENISVERN